MKTYLDCIPCFFKQVLRAGRIATDDEAEIKKMMDELGRLLENITLDSSPPETARVIYPMISRMTGNDDPFREIKARSTAKALELLPKLKELVASSPDPLMTAVRISIAGNIIDFGVYGEVDIEGALERVMTQDFALCDYDDFRRDLERADRILFIGDNAGEAVFDRLLIERLPVPTVYVVRGKPIINDVTYEDAVAAGIGEVAEIVSSGTDAPGTILSTCRPDFLELLKSSSFIISKGQGNYEALSGENLPVYFLFMAKCRIIARHAGVSPGDIILKRQASDNWTI